MTLLVRSVQQPANMHRPPRQGAILSVEVKSLYDCQLLQEPTEDFFDIRKHPYMLDFDLQPIIFAPADNPEDNESPR